MKYLSLAEHAYVYNHLNRVRHITLDPDGPGAVRIHLVPCRKPDRTTPFVAILNGQDILPLQISWAILLANLMNALQPFAGKEISRRLGRRKNAGGRRHPQNLPHHAARTD